LEVVGKRNSCPLDLGVEGLTMRFILYNIFDRIRDQPASKLPSKQDNIGRH
jgi:hypothetical protein